jgi:hypothetical protein
MNANDEPEHADSAPADSTPQISHSSESLFHECVLLSLVFPAMIEKLTVSPSAGAEMLPVPHTRVK